MTHCCQGTNLVKSTGTGAVSVRSSEHFVPCFCVPDLGLVGNEGGIKQEVLFQSNTVVELYLQQHIHWLLRP